MEKLLTISDTAKIIGVAKSTLRRWDDEGKFCPIRTCGNQRRYKLSEIEKFINGDYGKEKNNC